MKVSTLGLILVSASQRTIVRSNTAQARPKALVQVMCLSGSDTLVRPVSFRRGPVVDGAQAQDFQFALAIWRNYIRGISNLLIQQRATDRRGGRNFAGSHVRLLAGHNVVLDLLILGTVVNLYRRAQANFVLRNVVHVDHGKVSQPLSQLPHAGLDELLALLRHVVLGVFAEVAQGGGL